MEPKVEINTTMDPNVVATEETVGTTIELTVAKEEQMVESGTTEVVVTEMAEVPEIQEGGITSPPKLGRHTTLLRWQFQKKCPKNT